ncbi:hypothetical protein TNCV_4730811 [Trichonephila clavipes]|nr:hypothetical protein TNCV_4730811 [Trichonephila clavipes]
MRNYIVPWGRRCYSQILYVVFIKVYVRTGGHSNVMWRGKDGREAKDMGPGQLEIMTVLSQFLYIFAPSRLNFNLQCIGVAINGLGGAMHRDAQIQGRLRTLATKQVELAVVSPKFKI